MISGYNLGKCKPIFKILSPTDSQEKNRSTITKWWPEIEGTVFQGNTLYMYNVSKKQDTWLLVIMSANVNQFSQFFHWQIPKETLYMTIAKNLRLAHAVLPHYLVKVKNSKITAKI